MLVRADEVDYDYTNNRVSAVGNVQIYYSGSTLETDRVIYDQKTKRLHAEGNVRLTDADGKVTYGQIIDLSDNFRDGFVDSLRLDLPEQTRVASSRAERSGGNFTVFENGVYTACEPCKDNPLKPPEWQVKAARIIHDQGEKMLYFEDARHRVLRRAARLHAVPFGPRSDRQAQDRPAHADDHHQLAVRRRHDGARTIGRWRRTTTSPSRR